MNGNDTSSPPETNDSQHRGERARFLSRVKQHANDQVSRTRADAHQKTAKARHDAHEKIQQAHRDATTKINNTKFDAIYYISGGQLRRVNPAGKSEPVPLRPALMFDGTTNYVQIPHASLPTIGDEITIEAWIYPHSLEADRRGGILVHRNPNVVTDHIFTVKGNTLGYEVHTSENWFTLYAPQESLKTAQWQHVAVTVTSDKHVYLYINGEQHDMGTYSGTLTPPSGQDWFIGREAWGSPQYFDGFISEVRLWNVTRSQAEIRSNRNHQLRGNEPGLVGYWPLDAGRGETARELTGNRNGTIQGAEWTTNTFATDIALDVAQEKIYLVSDVHPFDIHGMDFNGLASPLYTGNHPLTSVAVDPVSRRLYWIEGTGKIMRGGLDGSQKTEILDITAPGKDNLWQLALDPTNQKIYWTNDSGIWRANVDGSSPQLVASAPHAPFPIDLAVDGQEGKVYWIDKERRRLARANLDGTQAEDLYAIAHPQRGLTLDAPLVLPSTENDVAAADEDATVESPPLRQLYWFDTDQTEIKHSSPVPVLTFGSDKYVSANLATTAIDIITLEAWVKWDGKPSDQDHFILYHGHSHYRGYGILFRGHRGLGLICGGIGYVESNVAPPANEWCHVAAVRQDGTWQLYGNGEPIPSTGNPIPNPLPITLDQQENGLTTIGSDSLFQQNFCGQISEVRIWNVARAQADIQADMHQRMSGHEDGLVGYWPLNESIGDTVKDGTENGHDGTIHGAQWTTAEKMYWVKDAHPYLMRGHSDGTGDPEKVFELSGEGGLALFSKAEEAYEKRLIAYKKRKEAKAKAARDVAQAHETAHQNIQKAHGDLQKAHQQAAQDISDKQAWALQQRTTHTQKLAAAQTEAARKKANAQQAAAKKKQDAQQQAEYIKSNAHNQANSRRESAQQTLNRARHERAKH